MVLPVIIMSNYKPEGGGGGEWGSVTDSRDKEKIEVNEALTISLL